jgi:hypothetical protein
MKETAPLSSSPSQILWEPHWRGRSHIDSKDSQREDQMPTIRISMMVYTPVLLTR